MKRMLVAGRAYYGVDALLIQRGAERAVARVTKSPTPVVATVATIAEDFQVDARAAARLIDTFVQNGLMAPLPQYDGFAITEHMTEYAQAQVLAPLDHEAAEEVVDRVLQTVIHINSRWRWNPIKIVRVAVSGRFVDSASKVPELKVWVIVRGRQSTSRRRLWTSAVSRVDGAHEIRKALRVFGPHVSVRLVIDEASVERPFTTVFDAEVADAPHARSALVEGCVRWIRQRTAGRSARADLDRLCGSPAARTTA